MNKSLIKSILYKYELRIVSRITSGVMNHASKASVMGQVRKELLRLQLDELEKNELWKFSTVFYRHTVAAAGREVDVQKRAEKVYSVLRRDVQLLEHQKNHIADSIEFRKKHQELQDLMDSELKFCYCTAHKNPACGHAEYQGRIYYKRNETYSDEEMEFISKKGLLAVEDVVMGPIWLSLRRNCKHRLIPISFSEAQTGDFSNGRNVRDLTYAEEQYRTYSDRLKMMVAVKKTFGEIENPDGDNDICPEQLKLDITRTYKLCRAWSRRIG